MNIRARLRNSSFSLQGDSFSGPDLVEYALSSETVLVDGRLEALSAKIDRLAKIVGNLVDKLPAGDRIEACGLEYELERIE